MYKAEFHVEGKVIAVERINEVIASETSVPLYQEVLTQVLANKLQCKVVTFGNHLHFTTECVSEPD